MIRIFKKTNGGAMMILFKNKLKSNRGASMMLALLFLFFCLMVGTITLTAATANVGKTQRVDRQEQEYLAVSSAARLIKNELMTMEFLGEHIEKEEIIYSSDGGSTTNNLGKTPGTGTLTAPTYAKDLLEGDFVGLYKDKLGETPSYTEPTRKMNLTLDIAEFPEVEASIVLKKNYWMYVVVKGKSSSGNEMTIKFKPAKEETYETTTTEDSDTKTTIETKYQTKVTFSEGTITKGGVI